MCLSARPLGGGVLGASGGASGKDGGRDNS